MANSLPPVEFATITGRFMVAGNDSNDTNTWPDVIPAKGKGRIIPSVGQVLVSDSVPPATVKLATVQFEFDAQGYISNPETKLRDVEVVAPSGAVNPSNFTYRIEFDGNQFLGFDFSVASGGTVDLTKVGRVATSPGIVISRGEPGVGIENLELSEDETAIVVSYEDGTTQLVAVPALDKAKEFRDEAQVAATAATAPTDTMVATKIQDPASQTHAAFKAVGNATYADKASVAGKVDESSLPAKQAANIVADQAVRDEVARAAIAPSTMSLASTVIARNAADTPLPNLVTLLNGSAAQVPIAASTHTFTNVVSPTDPTRTVWRAQGNFNQTIRARTNFAAPVNVAPATALTAWVYLPSLTNFVSLSILAYCTGGTWVRATNQAPERPLRQGWNLVRFGAHYSLHNALSAINGIEVRATLTAGVTGTHEMLIGPVVAEKRPKASIVFINDWGNKTFHTNGYPALKAAGIPVTWALRVASLGQGTYPNQHITLAEAETLMGENGNSVSFHSWDGDATAGMTSKQARDQVLRCQAGLSARGLWSEGAVHRPAWVQNVAPGAPGAAPYLATAGTYGDSYQATTWPPLERLSIPRVAIYQPIFDAQFDVMRDIRGVGLFYTHGVVPTSAEAGVNHATQAQFDYALSRFTAGMAEGWLEAVTVQQLVARERLTMPTIPPAVPALTF